MVAVVVAAMEVGCQVGDNTGHVGGWLCNVQLRLMKPEVSSN